MNKLLIPIKKGREAIHLCISLDDQVFHLRKPGQGEVVLETRQLYDLLNGVWTGSHAQ